MRTIAKTRDTYKSEINLEVFRPVIGKEYIGYPGNGLPFGMPDGKISGAIKTAIAIIAKL